MKPRTSKKNAPFQPPSVEELIHAAEDDEKKRGPLALSFVPIYSFTAAVAHMARAQERQAIIDARPKRPPGKSAEWNEGFDAAVTAFIRVLVERSILN